MNNEMNSKYLTWNASNDANVKLSSLLRSRYAKILPIIASVLIVAVLLIIPNDAGYSGLINVAILIGLFFLFLYWYFGSSKFLPKNCSAKFTEGNVDIHVDGWKFRNPNIEILVRLENECIVKLHGNLGLILSMPNELVDKFENHISTMK